MVSVITGKCNTISAEYSSWNLFVPSFLKLSRRQLHWLDDRRGDTTWNGNSGIVVDDQSNSNQIGVPGAPNYIADNGGYAVFLRNSTSSQLRSNIIGLGTDQGSILANQSGAIRIEGGSQNTVGGVTFADQNVIAFADSIAVAVAGTHRETRSR